MPDTSPTPLPLDELEAACRETGKGLWHDTSLALIAELRSTRASIGPDSERVRELEAALRITTSDLNRALEWMSAHQDVCDRGPDPLLMEPGVQVARNRELLLPGPDDIVVSREALEVVLWGKDHNDYAEPGGCRLCNTRATLGAALSQPHPAQEQQT